MATFERDHRHLKLKDLKEEVTLSGKVHKCLFKYGTSAICDCDYPQPEFHVSHLKHDTGKTGLRGIRKDGGFKDPKTGSLVWWSLSVGDDDIASAEKRLLEKEYPDRTEEQGGFLGEFATSPAFLPSSRMGSFRFTFPLEEVLKAYSQQFCSGDEPMMRVLKTVLYQMELMYVVLVHSPDNEEQFCESPSLSQYEDPVVSYRDGRFIWRSQAMCETHRLELIRMHEEMQMKSKKVNGRDEYYVWDHVAITLHVGAKVLKFEPDRLRENLSYCEKGYPTLPNVPRREFPVFSEAEKLFQELLPEDPPRPLPRAKALKTASTPAE